MFGRTLIEVWVYRPTCILHHKRKEHKGGLYSCWLWLRVPNTMSNSRHVYGACALKVPQPIPVTNDFDTRQKAQC